MEMKEYNPVVWFEIYVTDLERAKKFYGTVLQSKFNKLDNAEGLNGLKMAIFPENNPNGYGAHGALCQMDGFDAGKNSTLVYFGCIDCKIEESRVEDAGGKVIKPKFSIGTNGFISICEDTEGNKFGLHSMQ